jgi:hypothetical protein
MQTHYLTGRSNAAERLGLTKQAMDPLTLALIGGLLGGGGAALAQPGIRKALESNLRGLGKGGAIAVERNAALPQDAVNQARALAKQLRAQGVKPKDARIAIFGTGGTGKSTMGKALAGELGMSHFIMDDVGRDSIQGRNYQKYLKDNPIKPGTIAEQTHLLTQADPDQFDAVVYLRKPIEDVTKQIRKRGRGAWQTDLYNYPNIDKALAKSFETLDAPELTISPTMKAKVRAGGSYRADEALDKELASLGISPKDMDRENKVLSAALRERVRTRGILPYLRKGRIAGLAGAGVGGAALGYNLGDEEEEQA